MDPLAAFNAIDEHERHYRVYLLPDRIYFMDAATMSRSFGGVRFVRNPLAEAATGRHLALECIDIHPALTVFNGLLVFWQWLFEAGQVDTHQTRGMSWTDEVGELARRTLRRRLRDHPRQFMTRAADFVRASLEAPAPSFWCADCGSWRFSAGNEDQFVLRFASQQDLMTAVRNLPGVLGYRLAINVEYHPRARRWLARAG